MNTENLTLEQKVDLLLKYQRSARFWGRVNFIIKMILFIVFIVLPAVWSYYLLKSMDIPALWQNIQNLKESGAANMDKINDLLNNIPR
jgi:hypothetical protein